MTDGGFSKKLERIYDEKPALNGLWIYHPPDETRGSGFKKHPP